MLLPGKGALPGYAYTIPRNTIIKYHFFVSWVLKSTRVRQWISLFISS
jgi:hypothetical protein